MSNPKEALLNDLTNVVTLQYNVNDLMAGPTWITDHKTYDYNSAIRDEVVELAVSAGWRPWWSKGEAPGIDYDNCQLEIVDIYHFHISRMLQEAYYEIQETDALLRQDELVEDDYDSSADQLADDEPVDKERVIKTVVDILYQYHDANTDAEPYDTINFYLGTVLRDSAYVSTHFFFEMAHAWGMDINLLNSLYIAKNALNAFRTNNGYKQGTYKKIWHEGKEDNVFVMRHVRSMVENGEEVTKDGVYASIEKLYSLYTSAE